MSSGRNNQQIICLTIASPKICYILLQYIDLIRTMIISSFWIDPPPLEIQFLDLLISVIPTLPLEWFRFHLDFCPSFDSISLILSLETGRSTLKPVAEVRVAQQNRGVSERWRGSLFVFFLEFDSFYQSLAYWIFGDKIFIRWV